MKIPFFLQHTKTHNNGQHNNKKSHTDGLDVRVSNPHLSFAAGFGTLNKQVAGFHRAVPSTTLDKAVCNFL